jgi:predicted ATP-grasp superfamily ATP-dependent carboligase
LAIALMRIFVYEYTCAAAVESSTAAASLRAEGAAMLNAIVDDLQRIPGVEAFTLSNDEHAFRSAAREADYSLIIAPEFDGILLKYCRQVLEEGGRLFGSSPEAVALTSDKLEMYRWWQAHGVPTPETLIFEPAAPAGVPLAGAAGSVICKQRDGAGCSFARVVAPAHWPDFHSKVTAMPERPELIVQPFVAGQSASVAFLNGPNHCFSLPPAAQCLDGSEVLKYVGGKVPLPASLADRAERIARRAVTGVPGLLGYVGVDVVLGDDGRDWAIEINPRLTTSYIGLRALADFNLAEAMLALVQGREPPEMKWRARRVRFGTDGTWELASN